MALVVAQCIVLSLVGFFRNGLGTDRNGTERNGERNGLKKNWQPFVVQVPFLTVCRPFQTVYVPFLTDPDRSYLT